MNKVILTILMAMHMLCLAEEYHLIAAPPNRHETGPPPLQFQETEPREVEEPPRNKGSGEENKAEKEEKEEKEEETEEKEWSTGRVEPQTNGELYKRYYLL